MSSAVKQVVAAPSPTKPAVVSSCLNCGAPVPGHFCGDCGQSRDDHSRSTLSLVHEFFEHHIMLDSKMLRTAYALVLRPGSLTRAYIEGRRVRYVSPFRLYLFMSFAFFLALYFSGLAVFQVNGRIDVPDFLSSDADTPKPGSGQALNSSSVRFFAPVQEGGLEISDPVKAVVDRGSPGEWAWSKRAGQGLLMALQHPRMLNGVLDEWLSRLLVLLLPYVALWLALFAWGRGLFYVDNLAFALHGQAFGFLLATIAIGARLWLPTLPVARVLGTVTLIWTLLAYRHVYHSGWIGTVFKVGFIGSVYVVALAIGLLAATVWGLSEMPG
ncbi:MAG: DUF3667 domain-containing protein [Aliidongia sp.]